MISIFYEKEGLSQLCVQNFCLTVLKNFVGEQFSVSENLEYRKSFLHEKGISRFCVENFLSHSTEKLRRRPLLCLKKVLVSKIFMHRRGGIMVLSKIFRLTGPKNFVRVPFCFTKLLVLKKFMDERGRG